VYEGDPDTLTHELRRLKKDDRSFLRRYRQGHPQVQDPYQVQVKADEPGLPVHEALAKCLGCGQRGILERICIDSPVDPSMWFLRTVWSTKLYKIPPGHPAQILTALHSRSALRDEGQNSRMH
jgi:hypothetical protein